MAMAVQLKQQLAQTSSNQTQINSIGQQIQAKQRQLAEDTTLSGTAYYALQAEITQLETQLAQLINTPTATPIPATVETAYANAKKAANVTSQIALNQRALTSAGLRRDGNDFILAGQKFTVHPLAPTSLDAILNGQAPSGDSGNTDWTSPNFQVYEIPAGGPVSSLPGKNPHWGIPVQPARAQKSFPAGEERTFMFEFSPKGDVIATTLPANPFLEMNVSEDQWFALSLNAKTTGESSLPVSWTFSARDQTVFRGIRGKKENKHGGQPLASSVDKWCTQEKYGKGRGRGRGSGRGSGGSGGGSRGSFLMPDPMQPAFAGSGGSGGGGQGRGRGRQARRSYYCGGSSSDFQLRAPIATNGGLPTGKSLNISPIGNVQGNPGSGPATVSVAGINAIIPDTMNWSITSGPSNPAEPGSVMAPGTTQPIQLCPPPPATFL